MRVRITDEIPVDISSEEYELGSRYETTDESVEQAIELLRSSRGRDGYWSALNVQYDIDPEGTARKSVYALFSEFEGVFTVFDGFGYHSDRGLQGTVSMENFFNILDIQPARLLLEPHRKIYRELPESKPLRVITKKIEYIQARISRTRLTSNGNLADIREGMDIEEALKIVSCYR